jgi:hypothetical protein
MSEEFKFKKEDAPPSEEEKKEEEQKEEEKKKEEETEKSASPRAKKSRVKKEDSEEKKEDEEEKEKKEEEAAKSAPADFMKSAEFQNILKSAVESAVAPIRKENAELRKSIDEQATQIRKSELETLAKTDLDGIGKSSEVADVLFQIEKSNLDNSTKDSIYKMMRSAAVVKKEAGKYLFNPMGANLPTPGSAAEEMEGLVKKEMEQIKKSADAPADQRVLRAQAVKKVSVANPDLVKKVQNEEKADSFRGLVGMGV